MAALFSILTIGSGALEQPRLSIVLSSASSPYSDQEVAENAAIAANPDTVPITVANSVRIDGSGTGIVDSDLTSGGVLEDGSTPTLKVGAKLFLTQTKTTLGVILSRNILAFDKQQGYAAYAGGTTYAIGATRDDGLNSFISLQNANTGHTPISSPTWWALHNRSAGGRAIEEGITQAGASSIGTGNRWLESGRVTIDVS
jgi:hypothetical protein